MKKVKKAIFPVAGLGTRFLPATKASPKEMLPVVDKPLIQYAAEEAVSAGIEELIFVTGRSKRSIEDHFDKAYELETELAQKGKTDMLKVVQSIVPDFVTCAYTRQSEALGLGHAVLCAKHLVGDEPFAVILADDLIKGNGSSSLQQMVAVYEQTHSSILAVEPIPIEDSYKYGIIEGESSGEKLTSLSGIVEKPKPEDARSNLAVVGRYILTPAIFSILEQTGQGSGGEIQLTDGIAKLLQQEKVYGYEFSGKRYDCGSKLGYLQATVEYALGHEDMALRQSFEAYLRGLDVASVKN